MICRVEELKNKAVVSLNSGTVIGNVSDAEINFDTGTVISLIIFGKSRFWGLLGRDNDIIIPWKEISVIGDETILVTTDI